MASHRRPTRFWRACLAALAASTPLSAVGAPKASALGGCSAWESDGQGGFATGLALSTDPIRGDDQDNIIEGTPGNDFILALGGDDVVHGNGGDDVICGGDGDDTLFGVTLDPLVGATIEMEFERAPNTAAGAGA